MQIVKESWKRLWNAEEIRILVLASLCMQFGLVFLSPLRKRTSQRLLILLIWSFYLVADYVAVLALGNLLKRQNETGNHNRPSNYLMAFWAPFLLLHLGGPDTITSYSIEDNELWWRHFLGLAVQVAVAFMVLLELAAIPRLRVPAAFVFIAGLVKYSERTWSLRSSSMDQLRNSMVKEPDPGPDYAKFMEQYVWRREAGQSAYTKRKNEPPPPPAITSKKLEELLFEELKTKSKNARNTLDFKELRDCKGEKVLEREACNNLRWSIDKEFDESILLWHIATDLCFHTDKAIYGNLENGHGSNGNNSHSNREISLKMSNYLLYLLIMQPSMMPAGIGKIRFQDTCAEAKDFFRAEERELTEEEAWEALLDVETEVDPAEVKGDRSKSVLFDACRLAKELNLLAEDERWRLISRVWVEMLGYAAITCKTYYHAKQLSMGGELLTHVWLLMAHMGIGEQYRIEAGHAVAKLAFSN